MLKNPAGTISFIDETERRSTVGLVTSFLKQALELIEDPGRAGGWTYTDPGVLQTTNPPAVQFAPVLNNLGVLQLRRGAAADAGSAAYYLTRATDADPEDADSRTRTLSTATTRPPSTGCARRSAVT